MHCPGAHINAANDNSISLYGPCRTDPVTVYGVAICSVLPDSQVELIKGAVVGIDPEIDSPRIIRRRIVSNTEHNIVPETEYQD